MSDSPLIALATAAEVAELDEDGQLLATALRERGARVNPAVWNAQDLDWAVYDLVVVRSTWDYATQRDAFLRWAGHVEHVSRILNPAPVLDWNTDKRYLLDVQRAGVPVVPSQFIEPGAAVDHEWLHTEHVVKPSVSAGSKDTLRLGPEERDRSKAHVQAILASGRTALVQPYLDQIDTSGETALLFYNGEYSHAICKDAILERGAELVEGLFAPEVITARTPTEAEMSVALAAMAAIPSEEPPLYARIDVLPSPQGPQLLEVELTEPSMFLTIGEGLAGRCADAVLTRLR